ncbi:DNA cytosine methyltransferase [Variovorax sp. 3P27G3]|uniref:DNA cytosine methyltransferase n=1 Tax=Variovorax sp. 3P27G3 TaxID=2502214 RepID=UPI0010F90354|nr:DNA cytosine methyltransferase [Variovorax sp. 3P27G3]
MRVLIGCEYSGVVRDAFARRGHTAVSCDLLPTDRPHGWHHQGDLLELLQRTEWDLAIFHPPCTDLAVSGARHFAAKRADGRQGRALEFVRRLMATRVKRWALENPVSIISSEIRKPDQVIQPYMFGHRERKATCLWLSGLPKLRPTDDVKAETMALPANVRDRVHHLPPSADRWKLRSTTYAGIAEAMAEQWGGE